MIDTVLCSIETEQIALITLVVENYSKQKWATQFRWSMNTIETKNDHRWNRWLKYTQFLNKQTNTKTWLILRREFFYFLVLFINKTSHTKMVTQFPNML